MTTISIPDDWRPTSESINALPLPLRRYIHMLETHQDPALTLQQLVALRDQVAELQVAIALGRVFRR